MKVYDVFADKYIDECEMDLNAPPERYKKIDGNLLVENAARYIVKAMKEVAGNEN